MLYTKITLNRDTYAFALAIISCCETKALTKKYKKLNSFQIFCCAQNEFIIQKEIKKKRNKKNK